MNWHTAQIEKMKKLTVSELRYLINDALESAFLAEKIATKDSFIKAGQYRDEAHYGMMELKRR